SEATGPSRSLSGPVLFATTPFWRWKAVGETCFHRQNGGREGLQAVETTGLGAPLALALLVPMEAGIPIPLPADLVMLLVGEQAAAGHIPLWLAVLAFEAIAVVGTTLLYLLARGP